MTSLTSAVLLALAAQAGGEALEPGQRVERVLTKDERLTYLLLVPADHVLPLVVRQEGIDVAVTIAGPEPGTRREIDVAADMTWGEEPASLGPRGGTYRIEVAQAQPLATSGRVVLEAGVPRPATARDRERLLAEKALAEAAADSRSAGSAEAVVAALEKLERAASLWRRLDEPYWIALSSLLVANLQAGLAPAKALPLALEAAEGFRALERRGERGWALLIVVLAQVSRGEFAASVEPGREALRLFRDLGDRQAEARTLDDLGTIYLSLGETRDSIEAHERALELARAIGDSKRQAEALANVGAAHWQIGEIDEAHDFFILAGKAFQEQGHRLGEAVTLHNIAVCEIFLGEPKKAEAHFREALPLCRAAGQRPYEAEVLMNLGTALDLLGQPADALALYDESLAIRRSLEDKTGETWLLAVSAWTRNRRGQRDKAADLAGQALALSREMPRSWRLGMVLDIAGEIEAASGNRERALAHHREALEVRRGIEDRQGQGMSLIRLGRLAREADRLTEAREGIEEAIRLLEGVRGRVLSPERRMAFMMGPSVFPSLRDAYEDYVDVLMRLHSREPGGGLDVVAFEASERARARVLLEALSGAVSKSRGATEPTLVERLRSLEDRLSFKLDRQVRLLSGQPDESARRALAVEIEAVVRELEQVQAQMRSTGARNAALAQPRSVSLRELQSEGLDADTLLLEYTLGAARSHVWAVTATSLSSYELPPRAQIEAAVRKAHAAVSARPWAGDPAAAELAALSRLILGPVAAALGRKRVVIVADGALHYVPFAALPDPENQSRPLIAGHELVSLPSASTLVTLRRERPAQPTATKGVAVLADPVFDVGDERLLGARRAGAAATAGRRASLARALESVDLAGSIPRLPFSRREAKAILSVAPAGSSMAALDFEASRTTLTDPKLAQYRVLHLATHGFLNASRPELSGILLSLFDRDGHAQPGFLTAADAFNLKLAADLVVLSACRTALGKDVNGEGIVGLTRGFMYAGADRVLASLWKVDDAATAALMERFYRSLLGPRRLSPAAALRAAQLELLEQPRYRRPYYWAAFQLQGEWR